MNFDLGRVVLLLAGVLMISTRFDKIKTKSKIFIALLVAATILVISTGARAEDATVCRTDKVPTKPSKTLCLVDYDWIGTDGNCLKVYFKMWKCDQNGGHENSPYWMRDGKIMIKLMVESDGQYDMEDENGTQNEGGFVEAYFEEVGPSLLNTSAPETVSAPQPPAPKVSTAKLEGKVDDLAELQKQRIELEKERIAAENQRIADEKVAQEAAKKQRDRDKKLAEAEKEAKKTCRTQISEHNKGVRSCTQGVRGKKSVAQRIFDQYDDKDRAEYEIAQEIVACTCGIEEDPSMCDDDPEYQAAVTPGLKDCSVGAIKSVFSLKGLKNLF